MDALLERTFEAEQRHFWFRGFKRFVAPFMQEATAGRSSAKLLDAGCGTGVNLPLLSEYGNAIGVELVWRGLQFAHQRGISGLIQGSVTNLPFAPETFDAVVSFDVLYCLDTPDEQAALAEMFRVLMPGGSLVVNVAALEFLKGDHSTLGREVRRYTKRDLSAKLESAGFEIRRITYTNASLFPIIAAVRMMQRMRGVRVEEDNPGDFYVPPAPVNAVFAGALTLESKLIKMGVHMPVGSSLLCLAKKPGRY